MSTALNNPEAQRAFVRGFASGLVGNFINGEWQESAARGRLDVFDPSTGELLGHVPASSSEDVDRAVRSAHAAQPAWARTPPSERTRLLLKLADIVESRSDEFAALESVDAGKPISGVVADEMPGVIDSMRYFAGASRVLSAPAGGDYLPGVSSLMRREPVGVVGGITPWNYPVLQAVVKIIPALATGNTFVIKPAETTPYSTARLAELAATVLPAGVLNVVFGTGTVAGDALARHPLVDLVSFTGSIDTGRKVGMAAADGVKKSIMELGGNSPVLVFGDADLDRAADAISTGGLYNCGQDCMAASRIIVQRSIAGRFVELLQKKCSTWIIGDALDPATTLGPLNSDTQRKRVSGKVDGIPDHAEILTGGEVQSGAGFFFSPTIIADVAEDDEIVREEIFGPVFTIQTFDTESEALRLANSTRYGLAASIFTNELATATRVQNGLDFGTIWINTHLVFGPDLPVSGFGMSGVGVENAELGILEFTRLKHIMVDAG